MSINTRRNAGDYIGAFLLSLTLVLPALLICMYMGIKTYKPKQEILQVKVYDTTYVKIDSADYARLYWRFRDQLIETWEYSDALDEAMDALDEIEILIYSGCDYDSELRLQFDSLTFKTRAMYNELNNLRNDD